jgi:hypothetical protein
MILNKLMKMLEIRRIANKRLDKITDRIINGKNYGNYEEALLDSSAGAVKIDGYNVSSGADYFPEPTPKKNPELQVLMHLAQDIDSELVAIVVVKIHLLLKVVWIF